MQVSDAGYLVQRQETFIIAFVVWKRRSPGWQQKSTWGPICKFSLKVNGLGSVSHAQSSACHWPIPMPFMRFCRERKVLAR
jgi:hypothetical protein